MNIPKDVTYCASPSCTNKCGRQLTEEQKYYVHKNNIDVWFAYFCGEPLKDD